MKETWELLKQSIEDAEKDLQKSADGNKAAGLRLRKSIKQMQLILKELRAASLKKGDLNE